MLNIAFWTCAALAIWGIGALVALHWPVRMRGTPIEWDQGDATWRISAYAGAQPE